MMAQLDIVSFCGPRTNAHLAEILDEVNLGYVFVAQKNWLKDPDYGLDGPCVVIVDETFSDFDLLLNRVSEADKDHFLITCLQQNDKDLAESPARTYVQYLPITAVPLSREAIYAEFITFIQHYMQVRQSFHNLESGHLIGQNMIGESAAFADIVAMIKRVAQTDAGVYIHGETGTGKELAARSIHYLGQRCDGPFIPVNCGALSNELMLSELFGHEKGAFTGANKSHIGLIEQAHGGTLFLDEVDALSDRAQVTLLRYLQEQEFRSLGSTQVRYSNARVIVASNASLEELATAGKFRLDLFFRLDILRICLPPLRERAQDHFLLTQFFLRKHKDNYGFTRVLHPKLISWIQKHPWPGNIRELDNFIHRAYLLSDSEVISEVKGVVSVNALDDDDDDNQVWRFDGGLVEEKNRVMQQFEKQYLTDVLTRTRGNISTAAKLAEKERSCFTRLMKKYGLERNQFIDDGGADTC